MAFHFQQALRALILLAFCGLIFYLHYTGDITKYINPKYIPLSKSASILFLFLFFIQITRIWSSKKEGESHGQHAGGACCHHVDDHDCSHHHDHGDTPFTVKKLFSYSIIIFPLLTGFYLPAATLDASIADKKGGLAVLGNKNNVNSNQADSTSVDENDDMEDYSIRDSLEDFEDSAEQEPPLYEEEQEVSKEEFEHLKKGLYSSSVIKMDDFVFSLYYEEISKDIERFKGRQIEFQGFVYKEEGLSSNQLVISRFLITHCVADASMIGFLSELEEAPELYENMWVKVKGVIDTATYNGTEMPLIKITGWEEIDEPFIPYLYPINVRIL
ncbi:TIGR03943 family putative permease subunit [Cytobacillus sp. NCCP-133]|uniref:TIGR03943 family putative permease subunit n=1 Tax=Cytobacillus sp. NCCP-133 TaxID=766848 RepID=UPI0022318B7F|nr:TIGR03943 family protein [Cytobacillus sp. NCCP-133]GLB60886.1 phosphate ABC transporter substrate-binding protein [Cytobacillus sp. NCCP-133]